MSSKSPLDQFVEESERIRKIPLTSEQIKIINDLAREAETEEELNEVVPLPKIAGQVVQEIQS